ncbi:ABC transporter permease [Neiella marina]|uniref:ABC transporter permease n=1 Tax=Neiella marina TaxID=508461 RepID=A0A8J2U7Q1_9GAMM|nr:FtsX-like permease family protein [Neiella marina]GGA84706.1 ABC transporter permease [Neiella marina]
MNALKAIWQHWRQTETWLLFVSVALAIFACYSLTSVGVLMQQSLIKTSAELMGADRILSGTRPSKPEWLAHAEQQNLRISEQWLFNSMVFAGQSMDAPMQLVSTKAVDDNYPAKGELRVQTANGITAELPESGVVYADQRLRELLAVELGDQIELGQATFTLQGWIIREPDSGLSVFGNLPSLLMRLADVDATGIVQPGSRLAYRYLLTGDDEPLSAFDQWLKPQLPEIYRYRGVSDDDFAFSRALKRSDTFLRLAGLLTVLLTLAAMAVICQRFTERQRREVALLKAFGQARQDLILRYSLLMLSVFVSAIIVGIGASHSLLLILAEQIAEIMPNLSVQLVGSAALLSIIAACGGCVLFCWLPFKQLLATPSSALIQGHGAVTIQPSWGWRLLQLAAVFGLLMSFAKSWLLALLLLLAGALSIVLVALASLGLIAGLSRLSQGQKLSWRLAVRNVQRRMTENRLLLAGFTLASLMVMSIYYVRGDLIDQWRSQMPEGAANRFALNIQQHQVDGFDSWLQQQNIGTSYMYPVVRGRLDAINAEPIRQLVSKDDEIARRSIRRELSLTMRSQLPEGNEIEQGEFLTGSGQVSVESQLAERLNIKLGDVLTFDIAGVPASATVTSLRKVDWNSMRPNFYMILSDDVLAPFAASYLASFHLTESQKTLAADLIRAFPNVTLIDVDEAIARVESILKQSTMAMTVVLVLVTAAAGLLLIAQVRAGMDARQQELITMQTLGAGRAVLIRSTLFEFLVLGFIAGGVAVIASEMLLAGVFVLLFKLSAQPHFSLWLLGPGFAAGIITSIGWLQCRRMLREGALTRLRQQISGG